MQQEPTYANGKICYVELPAVDARASADFYSKVFNWRIGERQDGSLSFDDTVYEVSGAFTTSRKPAREPGLMVHIMVANAEKTILLIVENGGTIVQQIGKDFPEITALFADPAGNVLGIYQQPGL